MIAENIQKIKETLTAQTNLVAVSKTKPVELLKEAYAAGQRDFGENYIQELVEKENTLPKDIKWHFIGHLQRNKVKYIAPFIHLIHGVDTHKLLQEINKQGNKNERVINVLLQVHIAEEESKFGFSLDEVKAFLESKEWQNLEAVNICGFMGMATNTKNQEQLIQEFSSLKNCFNWVKEQQFFPENQFTELSMGMSSDYLIAQENGSTLVRIGSAVFGARN
jgi:pyridoxal phosphate enzyme (YggS family)